MATISFRRVLYESVAPETVLDALLRHGAPVPYSCKKGTCQTCLLRRTDGQPPNSAQRGLGQTLREQGYFLPCECVATEDMVVEVPRDTDVLHRARVAERSLLRPDILRLELEPLTPLDYRAGQFINLRRPDGVLRSYSLASVPRVDQRLELHVRRMKNGTMSNWIFDELPVGAPADFHGPIGTCYYLPGAEDRSLLLVGAGTGLAPLLGIARDALLSGHRGPVHLYHGGDTLGAVYLHAELCALSALHPRFVYTPCVLEGDLPEGFARGRPGEVALAAHPGLSGYRLFVCGPPQLVHDTRRLAFLAGASLSHIHSDAFELRDLRRRPRESVLPPR